MLNFITNQTKQYEAYTERYLKFKVEFRELVPYKKVDISISLKLKAESFLKSMGEIAVLINTNIVMMKKHQEFLAKVKTILTKEDWNENAININQITTNYYEQFLFFLLLGRDVSIVLNEIKELKKTKTVDSDTEQK